AVGIDRKCPTGVIAQTECDCVAGRVRGRGSDADDSTSASIFSNDVLYGVGIRWVGRNQVVDVDREWNLVGKISARAGLNLDNITATAAFVIDDAPIGNRHHPGIGVNLESPARTIGERVTYWRGRRIRR